MVGLFDRTSTTATSVNELRELMRYALSGKASLAITTRVEVDFGRDTDDRRRQDMMENLSMFPVIGSVLRRDQATQSGPEAIVDTEERELWQEVQRIVFPGLTVSTGKYANKVADIDHLVGHKLGGRDIFVTDDNGILRRKGQLHSSVGLRIMSPAECLAFIDAYYSRHEAKELEPTNKDASYWDNRLCGTVSFDYSNNNHSFTIGEALSLFETRWSKASDVSIHAYNYSPSIDALALAKGATEIADVTDASAYDFSSGSRRPQKGQVLIWRNINGIYAATKIVAIKDDSRGDDCDELTFEFRILADGATDFSTS